jgi:hypothetical protein
MVRIISKMTVVLVLSGYFALAQNQPSEEARGANSQRIKIVTVKDGVTDVTDTLILQNESGMFKRGGNRFQFSAGDGRRIEWEEVFRDDSAGSVVTRRGYDFPGPRRAFRQIPGYPRWMQSPELQAIQFNRQRSAQVIDLSDPGVISFRKKKLRNGREKITVIRKEIPEGRQASFRVLRDNEDNPVLLPSEPRPVGELKIIRKRPGGRIEIDTRHQEDKKD